MGVISLIRHGAVDGPRALYGHADIAATHDGNAGVVALLDSIHHLSPITRLVSSPLIRCKTPTERFAASTNLNLSIEPGFREIYFGDWDGVPFDQYDDHFAAAPDNGWPRLTRFYENPYHHTIPAGETVEAFSARVTEAFAKALNDMFDANEPISHTAIVCHGGVIRMILAEVLGLSNAASLFSQLHIDYASLTRLNVTGNALRDCCITQINHSLLR